jgi:DNA-binding CsgD family transcriptional regulator
MMLTAGGVVQDTNALTRGRESYRGQAWQEAYSALRLADQEGTLAPADLERLATAAYLTGQRGQFVGILERAHRGYRDRGEELRAVRCAFWIGVDLLLRGQTGPATGWFGRARRLLERVDGECVEHGYLLLPEVMSLVSAGDWETVAATAARAAEIGERFGDRDLFALAVHEQGHALVRQHLVAEGLRLLDEAMVAATTDALSPIVTGLVYCGVIAYCRELYELPRARQWTVALTRWCDQQPGLVTYTGECLVHRAEIMQGQGDWPDALDEAGLAYRRFLDGRNPTSAGHARYRQAEIHRLRGEYVAAERAYREASHHGWQPQPGLALLRLAQGEIGIAAAALRRVVTEAAEPLTRAGLLPAYVEGMLAAGDIEAARAGSQELTAIAEAQDNSTLAAMAATTAGAVELAGGNAAAALEALRRCLRLWQELAAPYEVARARELCGRACRALGDEESAGLELAAARSTFVELGAAPDLARINADNPAKPGDDGTGLSPRERQVLWLVAAGSSNRAIATELVLSERTVERHMANIFRKLGVSSRTAATAYAYEHGLR